MKPSDCLLQTTRIVPVEYVTPRDRREIEHDVRLMLASMAGDLAGKRFITETDENGLREYKFRAYVMSPADFWNLVRMEATRMASTTTGGAA